MLDNNDIIKNAHSVLEEEANAILEANQHLDQSFVRAVDLILNCKGRLILSGIGKSGHIATKLAATFASTGTPAYFVHAAEAAHGDLGMITKDDVVIGISYSGESNELITIIPTIKREGAKLIAMTGNSESSLSRYSDVTINCYVKHEACPLNLAPSNSTTVTLALGDALAISCLIARNFTRSDFARSHPGGALGRRLLIHVEDVMHKGTEIPKVSPTTKLLDAVRVMSHKSLGMTAVVDENDNVLGIMTEGDLRRVIQDKGDIRPIFIKDVMTKTPKTITARELAVEAAKALGDYRCNQLLVVEGNKLIGAITMHDLIHAKII
mgnify:CR=1 FL=1